MIAAGLASIATALFAKKNDRRSRFWSDQSASKAML
jgi:hypothetical protein